MRLLIAIDGSDRSVAVVDGCKKFVKAVDEIKIISVVEPNYPIGAEPFAVSAEIYAEIEANERKLAAERIKSAESSLKDFFIAEKTGIIAEVLLGNAGQQIVEEAAKWNADLIIVGSHGYGFWERAMIGSVSDSVIHHAKCSVLVVK